MSAIIDLAGIALNAALLGTYFGKFERINTGRNQTDSGLRQSNAATIVCMCIHGFCLAGSFVIALLRLS